MSWIEHVVEQQLADAARTGELDAGPLKGKPIPGIDRQREQGWWADQFVRRELSFDRRRDALEAAAAARAGFWRASTVGELRALVAAANDAIAATNINLVAADVIEPFDVADVERRWRDLRR